MTTSSAGPGQVVLDEVVVELNGTPWRNWSTVRISRELGNACGTFELGATLVRPWPAKAGALARIYLGGELAVTGYLDGVRLQLGADGHTATVAGRDKTADLVDSSVPPYVGQLSKVSLEDVAHELADPYNVEVDVGIDAKVLDRYQVKQGDTAWGALERLARFENRLAYPTPEGKLKLREPGEARAVGAIREGEADLELRWENTDRFAVYIVRGQGKGSDAGWGKSVAAIQATSFDESIMRARTLVVVAESAVDFETAQARANWERTIRRARSAALVATVRGWRQTWNGPLWALNQLVPVRIPLWRFETELLVDGVEFTRDDQGTKTTLRLVRPDAYNPEPGQRLDVFDAWADQRAAEDDGGED